MRRFFKWTLRGLLALVLLVLLLGGGALVYLNSEGGRNLALDQAKDALRAEGMTLGYEKAEGKLLSRVVLRGVTIRDATGVFFSADRLVLDWSPTQLISRRLAIDLLQVSGGKFERPPALPASPTPADAGEGVASLPVSIRVTRLRLDNLALGAAIAGAPVTLTVNGTASAGRDLRQVMLELAYRRVDRDNGRGRVRAVFDAQTEKLDLDLKVTEGKGGFAATLMGLPDLPGLNVELNGAGTLRGWSGRFKVVSDGADLTDGTLRIAALPNPSITLDARLNPSQLVPRLAVLKDPLRVELVAALGSGNIATVDKLVVRTTGLSASATGRYGIADKTVAAKVAVDAQDLTPLGALLGGEWRGRLDAKLDVSGPVATPRVAGKIVARDVRTPFGGAERLDTDLTADVGGAAGIRRLVGTLSATAIAAPQGILASATGRFDLQAPATGDYPIGRAQLAIKSVRALDYRAETLDVTLVSRLQAGRSYPAVDVTLAGGTVKAPQGSVASLKATGTWTPDGIAINTNGNLNLDLSGLDSQWARAETLTVAATAVPRPGKTYPSLSLRISGRGLDGQGAKIARLETRFTGTIDDEHPTPMGPTPLGKLTLDLSGLTSPWAKADRLTVDATTSARAGGVFPAIVAKVTGKGLSAQGATVATLDTSYDGTVSNDARTPLGRLTLGLTGLVSKWANAETLKVDATSTARPNAKFPKVVADVAGTKLSGQGVELATLKTSYDGTVADDARTPLGRLKLDLSGLVSKWANAETLRVDAMSTARPNAKFPKVVADVAGTKLSGQGVELATLKTSYDGTVADDARTPLGRLKLDLSGLASQWARAGRLTVDATSTARPNVAGPAVRAKVSGEDVGGQGVEISSLQTAFDGALAPDMRSATGDLRLDVGGVSSPWGGASDMRLRAALSGMGTDGLPIGDLRVRLGGASAPEGAADRLRVRATREADGTLFADIGAVDAIAPQATVGRLRALVAGVLDRATMRPSLLSVQATANALETDTVGMRTASLTLSSTKRGGGAADAFAFKLDVAAEDAVGHAPDTPIQDVGPITVSAEGTTDLSTMDVDLTSFAAKAGFAEASGRLRGSFQGAPRISGALKLSGTPPPSLLGGIRITDPALDLTIDAALGASSGGPDIRLDATGSVARVVTGRPQIDQLLAGKSSFAVTGRYRPGTITLSRFRVDTPAVAATGGGALSEEGSGTLSIKARVPDLSLFKGLIGKDIAGKATVDADLRGSFTRLAGRVHIEGEGLRYDGETVGKIDLLLDGSDLTGRPSGRLRITGSGGPAPIDVTARVENLADGGWKVDELKARVFGATASGSAALSSAFLPRSGTLKLSVPDLAPIGRIAGLDLRGSLSADGRIVERNGKIAGNVKATARGVVAPGVRIATLSVDGKVDDAATLKGLQLQASGTNIVASGTTISRLRATARPNGATTAVTLSAAGSQGGKPLTVEAAASIAERGATTVATITRLTGRYARLPISLGRPARITLTGGNVKIDETTIALGGGRLTVAGELAGGGIKATATLTNLSLGTARQAGIDLPVRGTVGGKVAVSGSTAAPAIEYDLTVRNLRPAGAGRRGKWIAVDARGKFQGQRLEIDARIANLGDGPLAISARVPVGAGGKAPGGTPLQGRVSGTVDLARLSNLGLLGGHAASGKLRVDMRLTGTYGAPVLTGRGALAGGRFENVDTGTVLQDINLRFASAGNALRVDGTMTDGSRGKVDVRGQVLLSAARGFPLDVKLTADRARLMRRDGMDATVTTDLRVNGDLTNGLRVAGTITVNQADVRIPERLPPNVVLIDVVEKNVPPGLRRKAKPTPASPPLPIVFDVTVNVPRRFFVRGRGIESEWQGRLKISGRLPNPQVTGALRTVRGQLDFLGQRFSLADSQIRFAGSNLADPVLAIDATTTAGDVKGVVQIRGTAQNPTFTLTSDPELPRDEVLARVLFGSDVGSLTRGQAVRLAAAAAQLAAPGSGGGITDRLRRLAGLDVLDVGSTGENISDTTVTAGKYVADKVLLKVEQGANAKSSRVGVEVEVFKNVIVESDVGRDGESKVGVKFRYDY